MNFKLEVD